MGGELLRLADNTLGGRDSKAKQSSNCGKEGNAAGVNGGNAKNNGTKKLQIATFLKKKGITLSGFEALQLRGDLPPSGLENQ